MGTVARTAGERMVVVLDSEYVFDGITMWSTAWRQPGWRTSSGEVAHQEDLWEQILWLRENAGVFFFSLAQLRWCCRISKFQGMTVQTDWQCRAGSCISKTFYPRVKAPSSIGVG